MLLKIPNICAFLFVFLIFCRRSSKIQQQKRNSLLRKLKRKSTCSELNRWNLSRTLCSSLSLSHSHLLTQTHARTHRCVGFVRKPFELDAAAYLLLGRVSGHPKPRIPAPRPGRTRPEPPGTWATPTAGLRTRISVEVEIKSKRNSFVFETIY